MTSNLETQVSKQLDKGRPDDDDGRETIDNRERGCGHLKPNSAYVRSDVTALSSADGELPRFVELDEPVEYRENTGRGSIIPGYVEFPGNSFSLHYHADGKTTTPADDIPNHIDRLRRHGFDGDHYGDITSAHATDLLMSVGKTNWETPEDYIDECRDRGLNLKIPVSDRQEPPAIEPLRTRAWIIHPHGAGEGRPAIIGYAYLTRTVYTTGTKATQDDPDIPKWAEDMAKTDKLDVVDRGEPIAEDDDAFDDAQTALADHVDPKKAVESARASIGTSKPFVGTQDAPHFEVDYTAGDIGNGTLTIGYDGGTLTDDIAKNKVAAYLTDARNVSAAKLDRDDMTVDITRVDDEPEGDGVDEAKDAEEAIGDAFGLDDADVDVTTRGEATEEVEREEAPDALTADEGADMLAEDVEENPDRHDVDPPVEDDDDADPDHDEDDRDVATLTVQDDDAPGDVSGIEVEFGRGDLSTEYRYRSFENAVDEGPLTYNALKVVAANHDEVDVDAQPKQADLIDAIVTDAGGYVPAYADSLDDFVDEDDADE